MYGAHQRDKKQTKQIIKGKTSLTLTATAAVESPVRMGGKDEAKVDKVDKGRIEGIAEGPIAKSLVNLKKRKNF